MTRTATATVNCRHCQRIITARGGRYSAHAPTPDGDTYCPLSGQPIPAHGSDENTYLRRAYILCHLAEQLRDRDPALTRTWLSVQTRTELIHLLTVAIAAIPIDGRPSDIWAWVYDLPAAQGVSA